MAVLTRAGVTGRIAAVSIAKPACVPACKMGRKVSERGGSRVMPGGVVGFHPGGMIDNSPTIHRWVYVGKNISPEGTAEASQFSRPFGTCGKVISAPNDKSLGYSRLSLRDKESRPQGLSLRGWLSTFILFLTFFLTANSSLPAAEPPAREYEVKGVLLFHLAQFVEWPTNAFEKPNSKFVIGILGDDPFGPTMDKIVAGEKAGDHPIVIERYANVSAVTNCHILFVTANGKDSLRKVVAQLGNRPVLTVSDVPNFTQNGGMVDFFIGDQRKVRLRVNPDIAKSAGLTVSSKLLRVAEVARGEE